MESSRWADYGDAQTKKSPNTKVDQLSQSDGKQFCIVISDCPKSLRLIVQFYRVFGFTYSGICFVDGNGNEDKSVFQLRKTLLRGIVFVTYQATFLLGVLLLLSLRMTSSPLSAPQPATHSAGNFTNVLEYEIKLGTQHFHQNFAEFKPILRTILQSVVRVFLCCTIANFALNLFTGGQLVRQIALVESTAFDRDNSIAVKTFAALIGSIFCLNAFSLATFNRRELTAIVALALGSTVTRDEEATLVAKRVLLVMCFHILLYMGESMVTVLFGYAMLMFTWRIEMWQHSVTKMKLDENELHHLKHRLIALSGQFKAILGCFSWPLTIVNVANIYLIISSACYLMIGHEKEKKYFSSFIFNFGVFALARLVLICCAGSLPAAAYQELIREIYERIPDWSLSSWLCFVEIKRTRVKFHAEIFSAFSIGQSAILTALGFALNYIVVLLQTESYGPS